MLKIGDMSPDEKTALLERVGYGHLGCTFNGSPYVVPMHYVYDGKSLYFFTTEGTKTSFVAADSRICFQVEEVADAAHWQSVMVMGRAERVTKKDEAEEVMRLVAEHNPTLTPALNKTKINQWTRFNNVVLLRVRPDAIYGRQTLE